MKNTNLTLFIAVIGLLLSFGSLRAQSNNQTFRLLIASNNQCLTNDHGTLTMKAKQTGKNSVAQLFFFKRTSGSKLVIASVAAPDQVLKQSGNTVVLDAWNSGGIAYEWNTLYAGFPFLALETDTGNRALSWTPNGGFALITPGSALANNADPSGNHYRFKLEKVNNTL